MIRYEDCEALLKYAKILGREVAQGEDELEALAKLQGATILFMVIDGVSSSRADSISNFVYDRYQESFIAYCKDKGEDEQE